MLKKLGFIMIAMLMLAGCGNDNNFMLPLYTSATLKISVPTATPARNITGAAVTIVLPTGVTPALKVDGTVAASVVTPSGTFASSSGGSLAGPPIYIPATGSTPGTLYFGLANITSGGVLQGGEVATVALNLSGFTTPSTSSFLFSLGTVFDMSSNPIVVVPTVSGLSLN